MNINKYFSDLVIDEIRKYIKDANGNEVFFTGEIDVNGVVTSIKVGARGNNSCVPVNKSDCRVSSVLIHNHPSGNLLPSDADMLVAQDASYNAQGFYIINNSVTNVYVVMEAVLKKEIKKLDIDETSFYIENGGSLSKLSSGYEERLVQIKLLRKIAQAFNENSIGVFEAGTGVGKSYAYLIPAMCWASINNERIVISTGTINLQQQLFEKDIPAAEKIIDKKIKAVLVKGRQNYVCKRRLANATSERELFGDEVQIFDEIYEWAKTSDSGSKAELSFVPTEKVWSRIKSESDACMGPRCQFYSQCFVMKVRKEASSAQIIVVNHHLLFADIESRMNGIGYEDQAVLPSYRRIIFDEVHGIERDATSFFSGTVNKLFILHQVNLLYRRRKNYEAGYIGSLAVLSSNEEAAAETYSVVNKIKSAISDLEIAAIDLLKDEYTLRLHDGSARNFGPMLSLISTLASAISSLSSIVKELLDGISEDDKTDSAYWEAKLIVRRLDSTVILLNDFVLWDEKREFVFWIQKKYISNDSPVKDGDDNQYTIFTKTPLDISSLMNAGVFEQMDSVVCTSATITINNDFSWWMRRAGVSFVENDRLLRDNFPSPFPYKKNVILAVPSDAPFPDNIIDFSQYVSYAVTRLINAVEGRTLVLFTSYDMLKNTFSDVRNSLNHFLLLKQGDEDNSRLLEMFKEDINSVLFATDSFWQGVDVPGKSLSQVIIVKLPFPVPSDPVFAARSEAIVKKGGNSFMELSVPEAVIKFRQGFGRLIRRSDDNGIVTVLDRRIYEKRYGSIFLNSLPETKKIYVPLEKIIEESKNFLFDR